VIVQVRVLRLFILSEYSCCVLLPLCLLSPQLLLLLLLLCIFASPTTTARLDLLHQGRGPVVAGLHTGRATVRQTHVSRGEHDEPTGTHHRVHRTTVSTGKFPFVFVLKMQLCGRSRVSMVFKSRAVDEQGGAA
jgi:hypothetical protein